MQLDAWGYAATFLVSLGLSLLLTPLALRVALDRSLLDHPGLHKSHSSPIPYLGGAAIVLSFAAAVVASSIVWPPDTGRGELVLVLAVAAALAAVGLVDDLRTLPVTVRLLAQVAGAAAAWWGGVRVELFDVAPVDAALTVLWIVGITNAFNLLDNMDGLSAGVAAVAAGSLFVIAAANGQFLVAGLAAGLAGCALGFLRHNFHPARIYMGDAGSLFLGFVLAVLGVKLRFDAPRTVTFLVPILVLGVPIFDTVLVTASRIRHRLSPMQGGRDHTSHRLVAIGIPVRAAVSLIYASGVGLGWLGLALARVDTGTAAMLAGFVGAVALFLGFLLWHVPVYGGGAQPRYVVRSSHDEAERDGRVGA